jgi:hypothetical protein
MTALELLEETVRAEHHASSRALAKVIHRRTAELLADGQRPDAIYGALNLLYHRFRDERHTIERDAMAEVLDWFEDEGLLQTA